MNPAGETEAELSERIPLGNVDWKCVPHAPGAYVIYDGEEAIYVGMAGRDCQGSLRKRLRDHASGQIVNMFGQYILLAKVQFLPEKRVTHPKETQARVTPSCAKTSLSDHRGWVKRT